MPDSLFGFNWLGFNKSAQMKLSPDPTHPVNYGRRRSDRPVTIAQVKKLYDLPPSFTNQLPWLEFDYEHQVVLLADGRSVGVAFELRPVSTEARSEAWLHALRDKIQAVLSSAVPEHDDPWILQLYVQDETRLDRLADEMIAYAKPEAKNTVFSRSWFDTMEQHLAEVSRPGGLFVDKLVTGSDWQGKHRKVRETLYRPRPDSLMRQGGQSRIEDILRESNDVYARLSAGLESAGIPIKRMPGKALHDWLFRWLNPRPETTGGDAEAMLELSPYPDDSPGERPYGWDFSEQLMPIPTKASGGSTTCRTGPLSCKP